MDVDKKWELTPRFVQRILVCPYNFGRKTKKKESSVEYHSIFAAENLATVTRRGDRKRILSLNSSLNFNRKFECGPESGDSITLNGKIPVDVKWIAEKYRDYSKWSWE